MFGLKPNVVCFSVLTALSVMKDRLVIKRSVISFVTVSNSWSCKITNIYNLWISQYWWKKHDVFCVICHVDNHIGENSCYPFQTITIRQGLHLKCLQQKHAQELTVSSKPMRWMYGMHSTWRRVDFVLLSDKKLFTVAASSRIGLDWIVQCFTSPPTQYRLYGRRFLQVKRPNQQYWRKIYKGKVRQRKQQSTHMHIQ